MRHYGVDTKHHGLLFNRCDRWWIAGIEQVSIPAILIVAIARIVHACFHKIAGIVGIAGVVHSDPNDRNDYMETRLNHCPNPGQTWTRWWHMSINLYFCTPIGNIHLQASRLTMFFYSFVNNIE